MAYFGTHKRSRPKTDPIYRPGAKQWCTTIAVAQLVERRNFYLEAAGSSPVSGTYCPVSSARQSI